MYTHLSKDSPLQLRGNGKMLVQAIIVRKKEHSFPTKAQTTLYNKRKLKVKEKIKEINRRIQKVGTGGLK